MNVYMCMMWSIPHFFSIISHTRLDWPSSQTVASRNVFISSLHHTMQIKVVTTKQMSVYITIN